VWGIHNYRSHEHANIYQSTNDVIPTALTVAVNEASAIVEEEINNLRQKVESMKEDTGNTAPRLHPVTGSCSFIFGLLFSTYMKSSFTRLVESFQMFWKDQAGESGWRSHRNRLSIPRFFYNGSSAWVRSVTGLSSHIAKPCRCHIQSRQMGERFMLHWSSCSQSRENSLWYSDCWHQILPVVKLFQFLRDRLVVPSCQQK